jgi:periplasmic protein TonB
VTPDPPDTPPVPAPPETGSSPTVEGTTCDSAIVRIPRPKYPRVCIRRNQEGDVVVAFTVRADGATANVRLAKSSGVDRLDKAALEAIRTAAFHPALKLGIAVDSTGIHTFRFRLKDAR